MKKSGQAKVDIAYDIVLSLMQKHNLVQLKVVAPYENVNSMKGKEFSIYLRDQMVVTLSGSQQNVKHFIIETEAMFLKNGIVPRSERDDANKPISDSQYFSYRNERSRVLNEIPPQGNAIIRTGDKFAFSKNGEYLLSHKGDINSLLVKKLSELGRYNIAQDKPVSSEDAKRMSRELGLNFENEVPVVRYITPPQTKLKVDQFLPGIWKGNTILLNGEDVYFIENSKTVYIKTRTEKEMKELNIPTQDGDYIPAVGSEELSKILELDRAESFNPFGYSDNRFKLNQISCTQNNQEDEKTHMEDIDRVQAARAEAQNMRNINLGNTMPAMQTHSYAQLDQIINPELPQTKDTPMIKPPSPKKK